MGGGSGCDAKGFLWGAESGAGGVTVPRLDPTLTVRSDQGPIFRMRSL
jgi:hypothetical protein